MSYLFITTRLVESIKNICILTRKYHKSTYYQRVIMPYGANIALCKLKPMKKRTIWCLAQLFDARGCKKDKNSTVWIWKMTGYLYIYHVFYCYVFPVYLPLIDLKCYNKATHISARRKKVFPFSVWNWLEIVILEYPIQKYSWSTKNNAAKLTQEDDFFDGRKFYSSLQGYLRFIIHKSYIQQQLQ